MNLTFAMIKPDAVESGHVGAIINRIESGSFQIRKMQILTMTQQQAERFYEAHRGKDFYDKLIEFTTQGPVVGLVLAPNEIDFDVVQAWRDMMGHTNPSRAEPDTLRYLYGGGMPNNAVHGSDSPLAVKRECQIFFDWDQHIRAETPARITACARAAHEVNRVYCLTLGDNSQPRWESAPEWQRASAINGVQGVLDGDTPEQSHERWLAEKVAAGWMYGLVKDPVRKTHPCIVPYSELPYSQQRKDSLYIAVVEAMAVATGSLPNPS